MILVAGLGNPGEKYKNSRHNVGFILLDEIWGSGFSFDKYADAEVLKENNWLVVKPQTFMNNSGLSIKHLVDKNPVSNDQIVIIHDDIDLPFGVTKVVFDSGAGGHNGVKSIAEQIGTNKFVRIKIGIAPKDEEGKAIKPKPGIFQSQRSAVSKYVLKDFSKNDLEKLKTLAIKVKEILETIQISGYLQAMNKFN